MKKPTVVKEHPPTVARRLYWLEKLIDEEYEEKPSVLELKKGVRMAQVGQWFSGHRMLRDNALASLAEKTGKPVEWFERPTPKEAAAASASTAPTQVEIPGDPKERIALALEVIGEALAQADRLTKLQLEPLFSILAKPEEDPVKISHRIALLLGESARTQQAPDHGDRSANVAVDDFTVKGDKGDAKGGGSEEQADQTGRGGKTGGATGQS